MTTRIPIRRKIGRTPVEKRPIIAWALVDDEDAELVQQFAWSRIGDYVTTYLKGAAGGPQLLKLHHLLLGRPIRPWVVSHHDTDPLNNQRANISIETSSKNKANPLDGARADKLSCPYRGVFPKRRLKGVDGLWWYGRLQWHGRRYFTSFHLTPEGARDQLEELRRRKGVFPDQIADGE